MRRIMKAATGALLACGLATAASPAKAAALHFSIGVPPPIVYPAPYYYGPPCYAYGRYACVRPPVYRPYYYRPYRAYWAPRWHHWRPRRW